MTPAASRSLRPPEGGAPPSGLLGPRHSSLGRFLALSLAAHLVVVGVGAALSQLRSGPRVSLDQKPIKATLVRLGKKRDERLLPRKEALPPPPQEVKAAEPPAPDAPPPPPPSPTSVPVPAPAPPQKSQPGERTAEERRKALFSAFDKSAKQAPTEEEPEGEEDGDALGDAARAEGERYYGLLQSAIRRYYTLSNAIPEAERRSLKALVTLRIGRKGELLDVELAQPSGNSEFDNGVVAATRKAAPFAPPPEHLRDEVQEGITFRFNASEL
jgi:protein TonB